MLTIEIDHNVPVPMRDGVILRADVYRPSSPGPWPVLVQRTPYDKSTAFQALLASIFDAAQRGYIVVHQDVRGRGASDGDWLPWAHEAQDGYVTIEWAARLPGSNGSVGMIGQSYTGNTQWSTAIAGAPSLRSIAPSVTWSDPENGLMFRGGATELGLNTAWGLQTGISQLLKSGLHEEDVLLRLQRAVHAYDHLPVDGYWELPATAQPSVIATGQPDVGVARAVEDAATLLESRVAGNYEHVQVPVLNIAGWYDVFLQGPLDSYRALRAQGKPTHLVIGPWNHTTVLGIGAPQTGEVNFGLGSMAPPGHGSCSGLNLDWHDHWLRGTDPTYLHGNGVDLFVMGRNEWRREEEWPLAGQVLTPLYLHENGRASTASSTAADASSAFAYDPANPVITRGGNLTMSSEFPAGPFDQSVVEARPDVLVFTTDALDVDMEVTGQITATLFLSTDAPTTDFVVRLCDVDQNGLSLNVADGITRVSTTPGAVTEVEVDLWATSMVFQAGHRIRVQVTSSCFPRWDRNFNVTGVVTSPTDGQVAHQQIWHDSARKSAVVLPVIPA